MAEPIRESIDNEMDKPGAMGAPPSQGGSSRIRTLVHIGFGLVLFYVVSEGVALLWAQMDWPTTRWFGVVRPSIGIGVGAAVLGIGIVAVNENIQGFLGEVIGELKKVTWPSAKETRQTTYVVVICTAIIAGILGAFDLVWAKVIKQLLSIDLGGG